MQTAHSFLSCKCMKWWIIRKRSTISGEYCCAVKGEGKATSSRLCAYFGNERCCWILKFSIYYYLNGSHWIFFFFVGIWLLIMTVSPIKRDYHYFGYWRWNCFECSEDCERLDSSRSCRCFLGVLFSAERGSSMAKEVWLISIIIIVISGHMRGKQTRWWACW